MSQERLVTALVAIIKGAVEPRAARNILAAAPPLAVVRAVQQTNPAGNIARILTSVLSQTNQSNVHVRTALQTLPNQPPKVTAAGSNPNGQIYYLGRLRGTAYGPRNAPMFIPRGRTTPVSSFEGWSLRRRSDGEFDIVYGAQNRPRGESVQTAIIRSTNKNVAEGLLAIIKGAVKAKQDVANAPNNPGRSWWRRFFNYLPGRSSTPKQAAGTAHLPPGLNSAVAGKVKMGSNNFIPASWTQRLGISVVPRQGYVYKRGNKGLGFYKNNAPPVVPGPSGTLAPPPSAQAPPPAPSAAGPGPELVSRILGINPVNPQPPLNTNTKLSEGNMMTSVRNRIGRMKNLSSTEKIRTLVALLREMPPKYKHARDYIKLKIVEAIRAAGRKGSLENIESNLGLLVKNANIKKTIETQKRRVSNEIKRLESARRYNYESNFNYERRRRRSVRAPYENNSHYAQRLGAYRRREGETSRGYENRITTTNRRLQMEQNEIMRRRRLRNQGPNVAPTNVAPTNGLPTNQANAINKVGGLATVNATIAAVPGGAPEIARAAEILNETNGNVQQAVNIKGADPVAVQAVRRLGGPVNAVNAIEGLETHKRRRRQSKRRRALRVNELKRVIKAVKKKKLISLVAHNVTKTHNIHENKERLKKYYQKVIKSAIMRTPLANIVKKSKANKKK